MLHVELNGNEAENTMQANILPFLYTHANTDSSIVVIKEDVVSNKVTAPYNHEEANTYMSLYAKHAAPGSIKSVNIVSYDTDVLVKRVSYETDVLVKGVAVYDGALDHIWKRQKFAMDANSFDC